MRSMPVMPRGRVDQPFEAVIRLRPAGAAIGPGRHRVGEDAADAQADLRDVVHAGQAAREIRGRDKRRRARSGRRPSPPARRCRARETCRPRRARASPRSSCRAPGCRSGSPPSASTASARAARSACAAISSAGIFGIGRGAHAEGAADIAAEDPHAVGRDTQARARCWRSTNALCEAHMQRSRRSASYSAARRAAPSAP